MKALATLVLALGCGASAAAQSRVAYARYELAGPMSQAELALAPGSRTQFTGELLAGERVERVLPVAVDERGAHGEPRWTWQGDPEHQGHARFLGWTNEAGEQWEALPPGLRARSRPPIEPLDRTPPPALFLLLGGCALASVALARKRAAAAAVPALVGCALAWWIGGRGSAPTGGPWIVFEGVGARAPWVEQRAAWEELVLPADAWPVLLASEPEPAALALTTSLAAAGPLAIRARGTALFSMRALAVGPGILDEQRQDCAESLSLVWWRADGAWSFRPDWKRGAALPPAAAPEPAVPPPGWLASGLPQGPRVCIAATDGPVRRWFRDVGP